MSLITQRDIHNNSSIRATVLRFSSPACSGPAFSASAKSRPAVRRQMFCVKHLLSRTSSIIRRQSASNRERRTNVAWVVYFTAVLYYKYRYRQSIRNLRILPVAILPARRPFYCCLRWRRPTGMKLKKLLRPGTGAEYCDKRVCLSVCLYSRVSLEPNFQTSPNFLCLLLWP